jgi:hypothetical protein
VFVSTGGRRTGMTKMLSLGDTIHQMLRERFNLYAATVEAEMFSDDERYMPWRVVNTVKALSAHAQSLNAGQRPLVMLAGYSYGGAHVIRAMNELFTRASLQELQPDLLVLIDPCGELNTLEQLYLVPTARRIVNYHGTYIVPQSLCTYLPRLLTKRLARYPTSEGAQPLVLLQYADYEDILVFQANGLDLSGHYGVPHDLRCPRDSTGTQPYLDHFTREIDRLRADAAAQ